MRYAFRQLRLNPGFASIAILTLALGIGANTALFSVVRNVILKPLPFRKPERLARVWMDNRRLQMREDWASYLNYVDYKRLGTSFESMAAFTEPVANLVGDGEPERVRGVKMPKRSCSRSLAQRRSSAGCSRETRKPTARTTSPSSATVYGSGVSAAPTRSARRSISTGGGSRSSA
jgi:hypothetical protein